jgi:glycogen operon protein
VWSGARVGVRDLAYRLTGSSDLYRSDGRRPFASINFVTSHDGFPLADLVSYGKKHNEANGEDNRDGENDNRSWNCGAEGPTDDPAINELRCRQQRNFLATLMLSQGTPMLLGGDEMGRTQHGNNNAWCQDNEISWYDWEQLAANDELVGFTRKLIALRRAHAVFRRRSFLFGREVEGSGLPDAAWFGSDGQRMSDEEWASSPPVLGLFLNGEEIPSPDSRGRQVLDESFLLLFNGHHEDCTFTLPDGRFADSWTVVLDTAQPELDPGETTLPAEHGLALVHHSLVLLRRVQP